MRSRGPDSGSRITEHGAIQRETLMHNPRYFSKSRVSLTDCRTGARIEHSINFDRSARNVCPRTTLNPRQEAVMQVQSALKWKLPVRRGHRLDLSPWQVRENKWQNGTVREAFSVQKFYAVSFTRSKGSASICSVSPEPKVNNGRSITDFPREDQRVLLNSFVNRAGIKTAESWSFDK